LYKETESQVWDGCTLSESFSINTGVRQGCLLSPVLFALYLNDLAESLPGGVVVAGTNIKVLLYADDIALIADNQADLQKMINALFNYCQKWSLNVNLQKSKILIFRKGPRQPANIWKYGNEVIETVNSYKY